MPDRALTEVPLQFGEGGRSFGILTLPDTKLRDPLESRVFVFLSAGFLHRVGPHGLHVLIARELAQKGLTSLRVDLAGNGDSLPRNELEYQQSVTADFKEILSVLESQLGDVSIVLAGLCSGADNAIRLAVNHSRVVGMVLLDPVCDKDSGFTARALGFKARAFAGKCTALFRYMPWLNRRIKSLITPSSDAEETMDNLSLRDIPPREQMRAAFESIRDRDGRVLSVFTEYALRYFNQSGQLGRVLDVDRYEQYCTEIFWPHAEHNYPFESHRRELIEAITTWATGQTQESLA